MEIAILLYDRMTALDAIGPYEVLGRVPEATLAFVSPEPGTKRTDQNLGLVADTALADAAHPDIVVIPGGPGETAVGRDERVLEWLRTAHETTTWTTSVCTGSLILGAAGLLEGKRATSHWLALDQLPKYGAEPTLERVVIEGKIITAAGVSAGIDMGLTLAARLAGDEVAQTIQLGIEYDPQPPFDAGSPTNAPQFSVDFLRDQSRFVLTGESSG
ncbi:MAG TPA: DJ-1/PfpI family protein [Acidimicrobiales bacterium]|jgi:putative intracellular protease/amidase|nr:DJ-1/PfpI family protein [Acidimicrobiales bacterium]